MGLADELAKYPNPDEPAYTPRVEFDGTTGFIDTGAIRGEVPRDFGPIFRECLTAAGYDPDKVRIGEKLRESHWQQRSKERDEFGKPTGDYETVWLHAYKFATLLTDVPATDIEQLVRTTGVQKPPYTQGGHWLVFQAGDQQLGKRASGGSTDEIIERYVSAVDNAADQYRQLRRFGIEGIQVSFPGDCIEGNQSQQGRNLWLTEQTITEQTRILRRLLYHTIEELAPLSNHVYVDVVNGNHDQAQRQQNTYPGDGWATEAAIAVAEQIKMNPVSFGHVEVRVPDKWRGMMTVPVGDSIVTVVHGHQWRRNGAFKWWADQAVNNQSAGAAHILQHGHWHEWRVESNEHRTVISSPTFDGGSDWYREKTGATSRRGGLVYLLKSGEVSQMSVV